MTSAAARRARTVFEAKFAKRFGEGVLKQPDRVVVSTGSLLLDQELGIGGLLQGRCYEGWGPPSAGKTTMALVMAAEQQKAFPDRLIGWLDVEHTFDLEWARLHGVDTERVMLASPGTAEDVADMVKDLVSSDLCAMVVVDSIGAMISKKEIERDAEEVTVGLVAKVVTRMIRMVASAAADHKCTVLVINQVRANIGGWGPETAPGGGFALQHGTSAQLTFRSTSETPPTVGSGREKHVVGKVIAVRVSKNKLAPPNRVANILLTHEASPEYGPVGLDRASEAFQLADRYDLFKDRTGSWYTLRDDSRHNGQEAVRAHLRGHPKLIEEIRTLALRTVADQVITDEMKEGTA